MLLLALRQQKKAKPSERHIVALKVLRSLRVSTQKCLKQQSLKEKTKQVTLH